MKKLYGIIAWLSRERAKEVLAVYYVAIFQLAAEFARANSFENRYSVRYITEVLTLWRSQRVDDRYIWSQCTRPANNVPFRAGMTSYTRAPIPTGCRLVVSLFVKLRLRVETVSPSLRISLVLNVAMSIHLPNYDKPLVDLCHGELKPERGLEVALGGG
jgi:hypothetical protein